MAKPLSCAAESGAIRVNNDLRISFRRTIRVPDNHQDSYLPPDLGPFPLERISEYANRLPRDMAAKGGLFFPMYRKYQLPISHLEGNVCLLISRTI